MRLGCRGGRAVLLTGANSSEFYQQTELMQSSILLISLDTLAWLDES